MDTNSLIREHFRFISPQDNLPISPYKYADYAGRPDRNGLARMLGEFDFNLGVEVGTQRGKFAKILCQANPNLHLVCVDPWAPYLNVTQERQEKLYEEAVNTLHDYRVTIVRQPSLEAVAGFPDQSLDFVFIDGDHTFDGCVSDIVCWSRKVKRQGIVAVHDYYHFNWSGVVEAVDAYVRCHHIDPWYVMKEREPTAFWVHP